MISRRPDVALALGVSFVIALLIVPLPSPVLDVLIAANLCFSVIVLVIAVMAKRALDVSTFPALLLLTTLFRLGLNVSTTRGILAHGHAGELVQAFGEVVVQGDVVVGVVIFLVITLVQLLVVAKGAERVAEVGARFTLDAMPGKQMSIDAALRAGSFSEEEAQKKRDELNRQSQLFGNMDGAMKFVKGDAVAGLIITAINLFAGMALGVLRFDLSAADALDTYSILSVGDALVAQISSLFVTIAAGILVTRVDSDDKKANLGTDFKTEVLGSPKVLYVAASLMMFLALAPGIPFLPFAGMAGGVLLIARVRANINSLPAPVSLEKKLSTVQEKKAKGEDTPGVAPITLEIGATLSRALGFTHDGGEQNDVELVRVLIPQLRQALYAETGVAFPGVRTRTFVGQVARDGLVVSIKDVPVYEARLSTSKLMALTTPQRLRRLGVEADAATHPINQEHVALIAEADKKTVEASGVQVWSLSGLVALHLGAVLRDEAKTFVGVHEISQLIQRLEKLYPELIREVVPKMVTVAQLADIAKRMVDEGVSIRDFKSIVEAIAENGAMETENVGLAEVVRAGLCRQIVHRYAGLTNRLPVLLLDPIIEDTIESGIQRTLRGSVLTLDPEITRAIIRSIAGALEPVVRKGTYPVILTSSKVRRLVRKIIETDLPEVAVLSFDELPPRLMVQPMGRAAILDRS
jgi:type III secretion protein V